MPNLNIDGFWLGIRLLDACVAHREGKMNKVPRILYVDDDADGCELMAFQLNHYYGYNVETALDGGRSLAMIDHHQYDAYILDYCLPDVTAVYLCKKIKAMDPTAAVLIYSALDRDVDRQHALEAGANGFYVKPEHLEMIGPELKKILLTKGFGQMATTASNAENHDRRPLRRRAGGII